jgi:hypothetical protein
MSSFHIPSLFNCYIPLSESVKKISFTSTPYYLPCASVFKLESGKSIEHRSYAHPRNGSMRSDDKFIRVIAIVW